MTAYDYKRGMVVHHEENNWIGVVENIRTYPTTMEEVVRVNMLGFVYEYNFKSIKIASKEVLGRMTEKDAKKLKFTKEYIDARPH